MNYTLKKGDLTLTVSDKGAELQSLLLGDRELLWDAKPEVWPRHAPVCFPWCGKLAEGRGTHDGRAIQGPQHGFIRDLTHTLTEQGPDRLRFRLDWEGGESWPWAFSFGTEHLLREDGVTTVCTVQNRAAGTMAVQLGFHPGFQCPFLPGTVAEDYETRFESGRVVPLTNHLFDNDSIRYDDAGAWVRLTHRESGKYIQVATAGFFCVLLWSQPGIPGFVCIEPWQGYPGPQEALAHRPGAVVMAPGEVREWRQEITIGG